MTRNDRGGPPDRDRPNDHNDLAAKLDAGTALLSSVRAPGDNAPAAERIAWQARAARGELRCRRLNEELQYDLGYHDGYEAGRRDYEAEMTARWTPIVREIREWAGHWLPLAERRRREAERARPRAGDYMGKLSAAEYFGTDATPGRPAA